MRIEQMVCVVTGAGGGVGSAVAETLLNTGAQVVAVYRGRTSSLMETRPRFFTIKGDLAEIESARAVVKAILDEFGQVHAWINAVGGFQMGSSVETTASDLWKKMLSVNFITTLNCCRQVLPSMKKHGFGRIVNFGSYPGETGLAQAAPYAVSKAAVHALTKTIAQEGSGYNIAAWALLPGTIDTPQNRQAMPDADWGLWLKPTDIAQKIIELITQENPEPDQVLVHLETTTGEPSGDRQTTPEILSVFEPEPTLETLTKSGAEPTAVESTDELQSDETPEVPDETAEEEKPADSEEVPPEAEPTGQQSVPEVPPEEPAPQPPADDEPRETADKTDSPEAAPTEEETPVSEETTAETIPEAEPEETEEPPRISDEPQAGDEEEKPVAAESAESPETPKARSSVLQSTILQPITPPEPGAKSERETESASTPAPDIQSESPEEETEEPITIDPEMATFQMVNHLKIRGLYKRALNMLKVLEKKGADPERIAEERQEILEMMGLQDDEVPPDDEITPEPEEEAGPPVTDETEKPSPTGEEPAAPPKAELTEIFSRVAESREPATKEPQPASPEEETIPETESSEPPADEKSEITAETASAEPTPAESETPVSEEILPETEPEQSPEAIAEAEGPSQIPEEPSVEHESPESASAPGPEKEIKKKKSFRPTTLILFTIFILIVGYAAWTWFGPGLSSWGLFTTDTKPAETLLYREPPEPLSVSDIIEPIPGATPETEPGQGEPLNDVETQSGEKPLTGTPVPAPGKTEGKTRPVIAPTTEPPESTKTAQPTTTKAETSSATPPEAEKPTASAMPAPPQEPVITDPMVLFRRRQYSSAAQLWHTQKSATPQRFTVILMSACAEQMILKAYEELGKPDNFFLLPRDIDGQRCYILCWGDFADYETAEELFRKIPPWFAENGLVPVIRPLFKIERLTRLAMTRLQLKPEYVPNQ